MHGGDHIAQVLVAQGVPFLFTLCGGHISPILTACKARGIRVIDTRHEATAVFAADAVSRLSGRPGVAAVTAGPGLTNTITAIKNAQIAQSPLILLGGATATALKGRGALQDIDQLALIRPHVKWAGAARRVADLVPTLERAFRVAQSGVPGPVFLECPVDLLYPEATVREWYLAGGGKSLAARAAQLYLRLHLARLFRGARAPVIGPRIIVPPPEPSPQQIAQAAAALARAQHPLLIIGAQAMLDAQAADRLAEAVERLGIPVYLSGTARGLLGRSHPLLLRHQRRAALRAADLVLLAGVPCDFRLDYGRHIRRGATLIAVNRSRRDLTLNRRPTLGVLGDPGRLLIRLAEQSRAAAPWGDWLSQRRADDHDRELQIDRQAQEPTGGLNPIHVCRSIEAALPENSLLIGDGGDFVATAAYTISPRGPLRWLDPGPFGTLGVGAGFAIGAALCRPGCEIWAIFGDGAFGYSLAEIDTFVRHGLPIISVIGNDAGWTQIARDQVAILGDPVGTALTANHYHRLAESLGAAGLLADDPALLPDLLGEARRLAQAGRPVVVNALLGKSDFRKGSLSI